MSTAEVDTSVIRSKPYNIPSTSHTTSDRKTDFFINFLGSCEPQLLRYLANFEIFGSDEASLRGIARDPAWTGEKRRGLIRDILAITGEAPEMHVRILDNQLDKFFS
ncbi:hypothetical protein CVT26_005479 [Gymnopilus dilepis]|uniref:Uncharacterized protein n=1 Tax=Gymnopilus dilepis TaxID=231916 RepID=A0A409YTC1_9AGAR|nr:hypothetical protein CVT26_005479 [Gymnopilus dilepis]